MVLWEHQVPREKNFPDFGLIDLCHPKKGGLVYYLKDLKSQGGGDIPLISGKPTLR